MDRNMDFGAFSPYDPINMDPNFAAGDPMLNPMLQYEQAYMYYRYLSMQLDYKMKCKEYDKLYGKAERERRIE